MSHERQEVDEDTSPSLIFSVATHWCALFAPLCLAILPERKLHRLPTASPFFLGVIAWRGRLKPVFDLAHCLNEVYPVASSPEPLVQKRDHFRRFLLVCLEGKEWVFPVAAVEGFLAIAKQGLVPSSEPYIAATFNWSGQRVSLLNEQQLSHRLQEEMRPCLP